MATCCCTKTLNLCNAPVCDVLEIEHVVSFESGDNTEYTLLLDFMQTQITLTEAQTDGENLRFTISMLNENFQYTGKIFDPSGIQVNISDGDELYDCIKFKTVQNVSY